MTTTGGIASRDDIEASLWRWSEWRADHRGVAEVMAIIDQQLGQAMAEAERVAADVLACARREADQIVQSARDEAAVMGATKTPECRSEDFDLVPRSVIPSDIHQDADGVLWLRLGVDVSNVLMAAETTRKCSRCKVVKRITAFPMDVKSRDGRKARCRACESDTRKRDRSNKDSEKV